MGALQERITSTTKGSITSVQAIYVPADDLTDPAPATAFAHLDATTVLSRADRRARHLPGGRPARLDLADPGPAVVGEEHYQRRPRGAGDAAAVQGAAGHHRHPGHGRALGRGQAGRSPARARSSASCRSRSTWPRCSPARPASFVALEDTIAGFKAICAGEYDHLPEAAFYMVGAIEEVVEKAKRMAAED